MNIEVLSALDLAPEQLARWREILRASPQLASPFFRPEFIQIAAQVRPRANVAVLREAGRIIGFFPFERTAWNVARPVGGPMSDYQAVIAEPDAAWNPDELLRACRLSAWEFDHQLACQTQLTPYFVQRAASPVIDLSAGYTVWLENRRQATHLIKELLRKQRKLQREVPDLTFTWHTSDPARFDQLLAWKSAQYRRTGLADLFRQRWAVELVTRLRDSKSTELRGVLSVLASGEQPLAIHFGLQAGSTLHFWFPAYGPAGSRWSPGQILLLSLAEQAESHGVTRIDLGKGPEDYKRMFANTAVELAEGYVDQRPLAPALRRTYAATRDWVKNSSLHAPARATLGWLRQCREKIEQAVSSSKAAAPSGESRC
jgi:CelD/BcsL family acetyltransferase involved in cellulose biosynthesis